MVYSSLKNWTLSFHKLTDQKYPKFKNPLEPGYFALLSIIIQPSLGTALSVALCPSVCPSCVSDFLEIGKP